MTELPETPLQTHYRLLNQAHATSRIIDYFDHLPGSEPHFRRLQAEDAQAQRALVEHIRDNADAILSGLGTL